MAIDALTAATRELVERFWKTMNTGDESAVLAFVGTHFDPDVEWTVVGSGVPGAGTLRGRDQLLALMSGLRTLFEPGYPRGTVERLVVEGEWAAAETKASGPMRDGRVYHNRYAFFIGVQSGRIRVVREYFDTYYVNSLGLGT